MKRKRDSEEKIISILKEHSTADLSRRHGVAENSIYRWNGHAATPGRGTPEEPSHQRTPRLPFDRVFRSAAWRPLIGRDDARLRSRLEHLAERYPKYGCPTLHDMLVMEGEVVNRKRTYRIYSEEGVSAQ